MVTAQCGGIGVQGGGRRSVRAARRPDPPGHGDSFGLLFVVYVESGNRPIAPDTVVTPGSLHPLHGLLVLAVYALAGLVFGLFVWVGIPVLILSFAVWLSKLSEYR